MAIICHCHAIRERTIVKAIHRGASTLAEVQEQCHAATRCGGCEPAVTELLQQHAESTTVVNVRHAAFGFSA